MLAKITRREPGRNPEYARNSSIVEDELHHGGNSLNHRNMGRLQVDCAGGMGEEGLFNGKR